MQNKNHRNLLWKCSKNSSRLKPPPPASIDMAKKQSSVFSLSKAPRPSLPNCRPQMKRGLRRGFIFSFLQCNLVPSLRHVWIPLAKNLPFQEKFKLNSLDNDENLPGYNASNASPKHEVMPCSRDYLSPMIP